MTRPGRRAARRRRRRRLTQWALDGLGIVLKPLFEVAHYIADGRLVEVLPRGARRSRVTLGVLYPTRRMLPPRTKSFIDLAVEELRRHLAEQLALLERTDVDAAAS